MATWLILDSTSTVVNVYDDLNPISLTGGQTKIDKSTAPSAVWLGWRLFGGEWISDTAVGQTILSSQVRTYLYNQGLYSQVTTAIAAANAATQRRWFTAEMLARNDPIILALATALGFSSTQVDNMFMQAASLQAS